MPAKPRRKCALCEHELSHKRHNARKKYCYLCELKVKQAATAARHDKYVCDTYGLQPGDYARMYEAQGGHCAICHRATGATRRLAVDHDHKTGKVRGLLCKSCNRLLGFARDDPNFFLRAGMYLQFPPAAGVLLDNLDSPVVS